MTFGAEQKIRIVPASGKGGYRLANLHRTAKAPFTSKHGSVESPTSSSSFSLPILDPVVSERCSRLHVISKGERTRFLLAIDITYTLS
jgi:hypothetical protein